MNDFLDRLVNRAMGREPVLERHRPSFFDSAGPISPIADVPVEQDEYRESASPARVPLEEKQSLHRPSPHWSEPVVPAYPIASVPIESRSPEAPPRVPIERPVSLIPIAAVPVANVPVSVLPPSPSIVRNIIERTAEPARETRVETTLVRETVERHTEERSVAHTVREIERALFERQTIVPVAQSNPTLSAAPKSLTAQSREAKSSAQPRTEAPASPAPPPVQVTIGRIEIRAPHSAPVAQTRSRKIPQPKLSLEAYLRSRNGGRS